MTVSTTAVRSGPYAGNGVTTTFTVVFQFFDATDLVVIETDAATGVETVKTLTTHYTVAGGGGETGSVTAVTPPIAGVSWTVLRSTSRTQGTDWGDGDRLPAASIEAAADRLTMIAQEAAEAGARAVRLPDADPAGVSMTLPAAAQRAGKALVFDGGGNVAVSLDDFEDAAALSAQHAASASAARDAVSAIQTNINAANDLAITAMGVILADAEGARDSAQTARDDAEDARDAAQAAVGAVRVTGADTTAAALNSKIAASTGLTKTVTSPAGNEELTLAVDVGTAAGKIVQVQTGGKLPALDGSLLTNLPVGGGPVSGVTAQRTSGFTLGAPDKNKLVPLSGAFTVTVPSAATLGTTFACALKNEGSGTITLSDALVGTLAPGQSLALASDGTTVRKFFDQAGGIERAYFRARSNGSNLNGANYVVIKDLRAYESVDGTGTDIAAGKTAIASSNAGGGTEAARALDANTGTYWASSDGSGGSTSPGTPDPTGWVGVNFGAAYTVRSAQVVFYGTGSHLVYGSTIVFEISPDGATWYALAAFVVADSTSTAPVVTYTNLQ